MNTICIGTGLSLTIKNFIKGINGEASARTEVMQGKGGWNEICAKELSKKDSKYTSMDDCFLKILKQLTNKLGIMLLQ
jgi:hypothetical protein